MLNYIGEGDASKKIQNAIYKTLKEGKFLTKDLGGCAKTTEFTDEVIKNLG